jgi:Zn-dependent protease with chaperone function
VALPAGDYLSFHEAEAALGPHSDGFYIDLSPAVRFWNPRTLPTSEKIFIAGGEVLAHDIKPELAYSPRTIPGGYRMKHPLFPINYYVRLAICITSLLLCVVRVRASDVQGSRISNATEQASSTTPSTSQTASDAEEKTGKSGKYDVDRIGQRSIGNGVNLYSLEKERALGKAMAAAIDLHTTFVADPDINDYINRLGQKIAHNSDAQVPFTIKVIDSLDFRTFALPGGFLYVDKGLIMEVDSEAELAGLMAHEIAHVAARHATRFATRKYAWNLISIPLSYLGPAAIGTRPIGPLTLRKFNRNAEIEADLLGVEYQYAAGYDPQAFVDALEKLHSKETMMRARMTKALPTVAKMPLHNQIARAFANYPPTEERIEKVQTEISTLLPSRNDYIIDTSEFQEVKAKLVGANRPILRRHYPGDGAPNGPVLHRRPPPQEPQQYNVAGNSPLVTKVRQPLVFSYLPAFP